MKNKSSKDIAAIIYLHETEELLGGDALVAALAGVPAGGPREVGEPFADGRGGDAGAPVAC